MRSFRTTTATIALALVGIVATPALAASGSTDQPVPNRSVVTADPAPEEPRFTPTPQVPPSPLTPVPPIDGPDAPDPFVLHAEGLYLLFSTQVGFHNVPVRVSPDMERWLQPSDALPTLPSWAVWGRTWAPGAIATSDGYVLFFAARTAAQDRQCIGVATAALPYGPFTPVGDQPLVCQLDQGGSIDPYPYRSASGELHLLWKADGNAVGMASRLYSQRLSDDGTTLLGAPAELLESGSAWEQPLIENPAMAVVDGHLVLLYSGGWWESDGYATGYATCAGPAGPCTKVTVDAPIHRGAPGEAGPGGAAVVTGPSGDDWVAYHAWDQGQVGYGSGGARSVRFAPIGWGPAGLTIG